MANQRRFSIKTQIRSTFISIMGLALLVTTIVGSISMLRIRQDAADALRMRMENNLTNTVNIKAEVANAELERYVGYANVLSYYLNMLYSYPDDYPPYEVLPPSKADHDVYTMKRYLAKPDMKYEDVKEECELLANAEDVFKPIALENEDEIVAIFYSTETGIQISFDADSEVTAHDDRSEVYFDYFDRPWYKKCKEEQQVCFTDVYEDTYGRGFMITCSAPVYDHGAFAGVVSMDMMIDHVYNILVDFDILEGDSDYAFLVDNNGRAVSPLYKDSNIKDDPEIGTEICEKILGPDIGVSYSEESECYYAYAPIKAVNWNLCLHVPVEMVLEPVEDISIKIKSSIIMFLAIFAFVTGLSLTAAGVLSSGLTKPLLNLRKDAEEISSGNLDHVAKIYQNDEIGDLAVSFNNMAVSLKDYIANLTSVTAEKERIGAELNVATQIQADMLPRNFPPFPDKHEFELFATMKPAKEVGGDFYDFFFIDDTHLCLVMADVSGKGVPAALFMVITKTLIKHRAMLDGTPADILKYVNEQLCEGNEAELFVTVWLAILDIKTGKGLAANAGHEHPILMRAGGDFELVKYRHSPAVATMEGIKFSQHEFELHPGDRLFVYTDGVPEATDDSNELFGDDRMLHVLNNNKDASVSDLLEHMKSAIDGFVGEAPQFDDITMLVLDYYGER